MRPDAFAAAMATGIVSVAASAHHRVISDVVAVCAVVLLVALVIAAAANRFRFGDLTSPGVVLALFTFVAACAVVGTRLESWRPVLWVLGLLALSAWVVLIPLVVRSMRTAGWVAIQDEARGGWELVSVATFALATVAADLGWVEVAIALWVLALMLYALMTWLIVYRALSARLDPHGFEPDSWILMGGLAIATLSGDHIYAAAVLRGWPDGLLSVIQTATMCTWAVATLWLVPLVCMLILRMSRVARELRFAGLWWAMVFPLGMYSAASHISARQTGWHAMEIVSRVFFWIALAAWLSVVGAEVLRFVRRRT